MSISKNIKWGLWILAFLLLTILSVLISLSIGELHISLTDIPRILFNGKGSMEYTVLRDIRLPRIYIGLSVGGALSIAGAILQGVYRNPLVEPYTMGISGGAALSVAFIIVTGLSLRVGAFLLPLAGFIGALATIFLVYFLSVRNGKVLTQNMVLVGVMISFIASSGMMLLMSYTTSDNIQSIVFWIMGSLDEPNSSLIALGVTMSVAGLAVSYLFIHPLNALRLGEDKARHLGINTDVAIKILFILASLLTGMCVAVAGVIGFVGLIIPQLMRLLTGSDFRILLISSFLAGGSFLVFCDTVARTIIAPNELPIGVITGIIGGLVFIVMLSRSSTKAKLS
ncbi:MAG TPA: iron ABC transporter permease [Bacteroidales bacterium]|nr:iron ABC transporter permease [Bacteroidales bacterium]